MCQDIWTRLGGATTLVSFFKAHIASETKQFFPYEWFDSAHKLENEKLPPYEAFFSKLRNKNTLDNDFKDYHITGSSELDEQKPSRNFKLRLYQHLDGIISNIYRRLGRSLEWLHFNISCSGTPTMMLCNHWSNAELVQFYHQNKNVMLKFWCTLPNLANTCPHKWTNEKFYPFCRGDGDFCEKMREVMTGGPSVEFTRKADVDETLLRDSTIICKVIVEFDASQLDPFSMCQDMSTGLDGTISLDSFLETIKAIETKVFFSIEWFDSADKLENQNLSPYEAFFIKLRNKNNLE